MASFIDKFNASETASLLPIAPPSPDFELVAPESKSLSHILRLHMIAHKQGFMVSDKFLHDLMTEPYHERDFPQICDALIKRIALIKLGDK